VIVPLSTPGYFNALNGARSVLDVPAHGWAWLQVRAWDARLGTTYGEAVTRGSGGYGQSALFYARGNYALGSIPEPPAPLIGLQSFSVLPVVPEPSAWLFLVFGLGGLVWSVRRKKASFP
jgi:hypothetical protein